ncbi:hypothetical protein Tcan_00368 [Toxocara canis]|uniref:Uncharacterized protein n=1 Tax=Toxocara canis TaxID=6265 RepID=A0A0B2UMI5_TOXCA|nr:hypothetical protein Tcan_00368 [Toxocara canis]
MVCMGSPPSKRRKISSIPSPGSSSSSGCSSSAAPSEHLIEGHVFAAQHTGNVKWSIFEEEGDFWWGGILLGNTGAVKESNRRRNIQRMRSAQRTDFKYR